jgi:aryl-alcohol dehydrogenase-like predicted oxidoreductase
VALIELLRRVAAQHDATPGQVALAWLLGRADWIVPIPGTRRLERLDENIGATEVTLAPEDLRKLEEAAAAIPIQGDRYPEHLERLTGL